MDLTTIVRILGVVGLIAVSLLLESRVLSSETDGHYEELVSKEKPCLVTRTSSKNGFHREVKTKILLYVEPHEVNSELIVLKERFPSGMYIDLFETKSLEEFGGSKVYSEKDMDIEKPEYLSSEHNFYVFGNLKRKGSLMYTELPLQIHLRYHKPSEKTDFEQVLLKPPELFVRMPETYRKIDGDGTESIKCDHKTHRICQWKQLQCSFNPSDGIINFSIPVGKSSDTGIVASATLLVTLGATIFLAKSILLKDVKGSEGN